MKQKWVPLEILGRKLDANEDLNKENIHRVRIVTFS